jgi:hypothetical protein
MFISKHLLAAMLLATLTVSSCVKKEEETVVVEAPKAEVLSCSPYTDLVLKNHNPNGIDYIINCEITTQSSITINPGVTIVMKSGAGLRVNGVFRAEGTADSPITIKGESDTRGYWKNIILYSNDNNNIMKYCNISNGGGATITDIPAAYNANLIIFGKTGLIMSNCIIEKSNALGIFAVNSLNPTNRNFLTFSNNTLRNNKLAPIQTLPANITAIEPNNIFENNEANYIEILSGTITGNNTWYAQSAPYMCKGEVVVTGSNSDNLTVREGVEIVFLSDATLASEKNSACYISFNGTANNRIKLRGILPVKGAWGGVCFQTMNILNSVKYTDISDGGGVYFGSNADSRGNFVIGGISTGKCVIQDTNITNSGNCGIGLTYYSSSNPNAYYVDGGGNTFANNAGNDVCR